MNSKNMTDLEAALGALPSDERRRFEDTFAGKLIPPLYYDVIAKRIFHPDVHPNRLNFLLRSIAKDETIDVRTSASNEGFHISANSKTMISDIPAWLKDHRLTDLEVQKIKQDFIFSRAELYCADMLLVQYSANAGQPRSELSYANADEVLIVVLMVESPQAFHAFDQVTDRYIHRFTRMTADTGLSYKTKAQMIYVQLDKCLRQLKEGRNAESPDNQPDKIQEWLAMIANVNDEKVKDRIAADEELQDIRAEAAGMIQSKEVQIMMIQEKLARLDWNTSMAESREEGRKEGWKEGEEKGHAEGEDNGLKIAVDILHLRRDGKSDSDIVIFLMKKYNKSESQAEEVLRRMSEYA